MAQGEELARNIGVLHDKVSDIQGSLNQRIIAMSDDINSVAEEIRQLNVKIASTEGGRATGSDAVRCACSGRRPSSASPS